MRFEGDIRIDDARGVSLQMLESAAQFLVGPRPRLSAIRPAARPSGSHFRESGREEILSMKPHTSWLWCPRNFPRIDWDLRQMLTDDRHTRQDGSRYDRIVDAHSQPYSTISDQLSGHRLETKLRTRRRERFLCSHLWQRTRRKPPQENILRGLQETPNLLLAVGS